MRLEIGHLDVGDQTPLEARAQPLLEVGDVARHLVAGEHDLLVRLVDRVEGVEELLLSLLLAGDELDVVDQQQLHVAVAVAERRHAVIADGLDQFVDEGLGGEVHDPRPGVALEETVADRVQQMGLAEADAAVEKQRVVGLGMPVGDGEARRVGHLVARADDERVEGVLAVEDRAAVVDRPREGQVVLSRPFLLLLALNRLENDGALATGDRGGGLADQDLEVLVEPVPGELAGHRDDQRAFGEALLGRRGKPRRKALLVDVRAHPLLDLAPEIERFLRAHAAGVTLSTKNARSTVGTFLK